jgi:methylisocitrate lyase
MTTRLRELLAAPGLIVAPACHDPMTARIAEQLGYQVIYLGGFAYGAASAVTEPRQTMTEMVDAARRITSVVNVPLIVDAGAGWGDPMHVMRTVQEFQQAGVAAIHLEDQLFPKRAHYHRDYQEHSIPAEEAAIKIEFACKARTDPDFVIIGRTDAMKTEGFEEGVRRSKLYAEAGADVIMNFPNTAEEAERAPREIPAPLAYTSSYGNRVGRPVYSTQELEAMGWKIDIEAIAIICAAYRAAFETLKSIKETGRAGLDQAEAIRLRKAIEDTIGLEEYYRIEEQTVEAANRRGLV